MSSNDSQNPSCSKWADVSHPVVLVYPGYKEIGLRQAQQHLEGA